MLNYRISSSSSSSSLLRLPVRLGKRREGKGEREIESKDKGNFIRKGSSMLHSKKMPFSQLLQNTTLS
jgi:hypothetical protein